MTKSGYSRGTTEELTLNRTYQPTPQPCFARYTGRFWRAGCFYILFCLGAAATANPKHLSFEHILPDQVSTIGYIKAIGQGPSGAMWFGGANGLVRYNGYELDIYRHDKDDSGSLSDSYINDILLSRSGELWIATNKGVNRYNAALDAFIRYDTSTDTYPESDDVNAILQDRDGSFWLATAAGLFRFDPATGSVVHQDLRDSKGKEAGFTWKLVQDQDGLLWLSHQNRGVTRFDPTTGEVRSYRHRPGQEGGLTFDDVRELYIDSRNRLWAGTYGGGLNRYDRERDEFVFVRHDSKEKSAVVWAVLEDNKGNLWIGDGSAVYVREPGSNRFARFTNNSNDPDSLGNYVVNELFQDKTGDIWIGFFPSGVDRVDRLASAFRNYDHNSLDSNSVTDGGVLSALEDPQGNLWVGAGYGLNYFDRKTGTFTHYTHDPANPDGLTGNTILSMAGRGQHELWLGVWSGGLNRLDLETGQFSHYLPDEQNPGSLLGREPWSVLADRQGNLWAATEKGINRYNRATNDFTQLQPKNESGENITLYSRVIYQDAKDNIWVGAMSGLYRLNPGTGRFTRYHNDPGDPNSLNVNFVLSIFEDSRNRLWVGTDGGGLSLFNRDRGIFKSYTAESGLSDNVVAGIIEDREGYLWLGTQRGLSRFDPEKESFRNFDKRHGLSDNLFNRNTPLLLQDGDLFFGNSKGFTLFDPDELGFNEHAPNVVFTELKVLNNVMEPGAPGSPLQKAISQADSITLSHEQSVFSISFAALNFRLPEENQYTYRLHGFDREWNYVGNERSATYTNLDPGTYTFEVRGSNNDGVWSKEPARLVINILPPFWRTWWAYTLYAIGLLTLIFWFLRIQRLKVSYEKQKVEHERAHVRRLIQVDRLKDEFLANTSHELRTPLNGIIGLAESLTDGAAGTLPAKARENLAMIAASGKRLANLVNDILDFSKLRNKGITLHKRPVDVRVLVDVVLTLSRPLLQGKSIQLRNAVPQSLPPVVADEDRLLQIFHNLVGNAIKFTDEGTVTVTAGTVDEGVVISVEDTGRGIPEESLESIFTPFEQLESSFVRTQGGAGLGLSITRQLVELHGGNISVDSEPGKGSRFCISLPAATDAKPEALHTEHVEVLKQSNFESPDDDIPHPTSKPEPQMQTGQHRHVLVVDDDAVNRQVLTDILSLRNYRVTECSSGFEAIEYIEQHPDVDLVLLDVMMPQLSGYQTCQRLRAIHKTHELPIILLTARTQTGDLVSGFDVGANDFLTKPVTKEELVARVAMHIQLVDAMRNLDKKVAERTAELRRKNDILSDAQNALKEANRRLEEASLSDPLTGLHNRRFLSKSLPADVSVVERRYQSWKSSDQNKNALPRMSDLLFLLLDVDHFKSVNDEYGHNAGDRVLEQISRLLETILRESDYLVRWGGEEFLVVIRYCSRAEAADLAERIRRGIEAVVFKLDNGQSLQRTCSIGLAAHPFYPNAPSALSWEQVVDVADRALYMAKQFGRNGWVYLSSPLGYTGTALNPATEENINQLQQAGALVVQSSWDADLPVE